MRSGLEQPSWDDVAAQQAYDDHLRRIRSRSTEDGREPRLALKETATALAALIGLLGTASVVQVLVVGPTARLFRILLSVVLADGMSPARLPLVGGVCMVIGLALVSLGWLGRRTGEGPLKPRAFVRAGTIYLGLHFAAYGAFVGLAGPPP